MALKPCPFCDGPQPLDSCNCTYAVQTRIMGFDAAKKAWARSYGRRDHAVASGVAKPAGSSGVEPGGAARKVADPEQNNSDNAGSGGEPKGRPRDSEGRYLKAGSGADRVGGAAAARPSPARPASRAGNPPWLAAPGVCPSCDKRRRAHYKGTKQYKADQRAKLVNERRAAKGLPPKPPTTE